MPEDRLDSILAKQRAVTARREAAEEEQRRKKAEQERREQELLVVWDALRNGLKKVVLDLNKRMESNGVALEYEEIAPTYNEPHSASIGYSAPFEYRIQASSLRVSVSRGAQLTASIIRRSREIRSKHMHVHDFDEAAQQKWVLDFLEFTAEPDAAE